MGRKGDVTPFESVKTAHPTVCQFEQQKSGENIPQNGYLVEGSMGKRPVGVGKNLPNEVSKYEKLPQEISQEMLHQTDVRMDSNGHARGGGGDLSTLTRGIVQNGFSHAYDPDLEFDGFLASQNTHAENLAKIASTDHLPGGVVETAFWAAENGFEDKTSKGRVLEHKKGQNVENSHQEDQAPHGLRFDPPKGVVEPLTLKLSFQKRQVPHELRFDLPRGGGSTH